MTITRHRGAIALAATAMVAAVAVAIPATATAGGNDITVGEGESIQAALDAAGPGATVVVEGHHVENVWINKSNIKLVGRGNASIALPGEPALNPCTDQDPEGNQIDTVVCVAPASLTPDDFPPDVERIRSVSVKGLAISGATLDGIGVVFTDNVVIRDNVITDHLCDGIFVIFSNGVTIQRNTVGGSTFCSGIDTPQVTNGRIGNNVSTDNAFGGIIMDDSSNMVVSKNTATGNCFGITAVNNPDFFEASSDNVRIVQNNASANNTVCYPFDLPGEQTIPVGAVGIVAAATDRVVIERNTANDNVTDEFTITASGIFLTDFEGLLATRSRVNKNTATGNISAVGPVDLWLDSAGGFERVMNNKCDYSTPDASWCTG